MNEMEKMEKTEELSRILAALRPLQGQPLRCLALARQLGISTFRVWRLVELLESRGVLYTLPAWCPPPLHPGRRVVRSAVLFLRETTGLDPCTYPGAYTGGSGGCSPDGDVRFRSWMIRQVMFRERARSPTSRFGHYSTPAMSRAALVVAAPRITVGYQFPFHPCPGKRFWTGLRKSLREGWIDRGLVVYPGSRAFFGGKGLVAVPVVGFLAGYRGWMEVLESGDPEVLRRQVRASNAAIHMGRFAHLRRTDGEGRVSGATGSPA
jgi:hypothetical protein